MYAHDLSLGGKVALITGGKGGIGGVVARTFAEAGADVAVADVVLEDGALEAAAGEIQELGRRSLAVQADITRKTDVDTMVKRVVDKLGAIDILVNTPALITRNIPLVELSEDDWDRVIDTKLKGYFLCSQAAGKIMIEQRRGNIINFSGTMGFKTSFGRTAYHIAQAGTVTLTRVLAFELAPYNIRANAVAPCVVGNTPFSRDVWSDPDVLQACEPTSPFGRLVEASEVANVVLFLASDASSFVTGQTILVDGGALL